MAGTLSAASLGLLTGSGTVTLTGPLNPSNVAISLSAPTAVSGALSFTLSWTVGGNPGNIAQALTTAQINGGINVEGSQIGLPSVDQISFTVAGAFTSGVLKVFVGLYTGGAP